MGGNQNCNVVCQRVFNNGISHEDYKICLIDNELMYHSMVQIGHTHHHLETIETLKKSLTPTMIKKCFKKNGGVFITYGFGHKNERDIYIYIYI